MIFSSDVMHLSLTAGHDSVYSLRDDTLTPTEPALEGSRQEQPYVVRGLRDPPTLTKAAGQSGSKVRLMVTESSCLVSSRLCACSL